jgi:hypothetical protein
MGVDAVYIAGPKSEEPYKDGLNHERFLTLPVLFDDGKGNTIYGSQRRYAQRARVVDTAKLAAIKPAKTNDDLDCLRPYVDAVENGPDSQATIDRPSTDLMQLHAKFDAGQSLLVQETWDPVWRASIDGKPFPIRTDVMGFMVVDPPAGEHTVRLEFPMPLENRVGWGITALTVIALGVLMVRKER